MRERPTAANVEAWNDAMAAKYDIVEYHDRGGYLVRWVNGGRVSSVLWLLDVARDHRVLEVGCGPGMVLSQVPSDHRTGVDLSAGLIARAQQRCGPSVVLKKADAHELPFPDGAFDRVYCTEVLEHVLEPARAVAEIVRVLAPGGRAVLTVPDERTVDRAKRWLRRLGLFERLLGAKSAGQYEPPDENEWHLHELDLAGLRSLATAAGLREERVVFVPNRLFPVHYVVSYVRASERGAP